MLLGVSLDNRYLYHQEFSIFEWVNHSKYIMSPIEANNVLQLVQIWRSLESSFPYNFQIRIELLLPNLFFLVFSCVEFVAIINCYILQYCVILFFLALREISSSFQTSSSERTVIITVDSYFAILDFKLIPSLLFLEEFTLFLVEFIFIRFIRCIWIFADQL